MLKRKLLGCLAAALLVTTSAWGQENDVEKLVDILIKKQVITKEEAKSLKTEIAQKKPEEKQSALVGAGKEGFFIKSADGDFVLKLRGLVNLDGRFFNENNSQPSGTADQFLLRRARGYFEGTIFKYYDFRIMQEFGQAKVELYDAYIDVTYFPEAKLKVGRFTAPVALGFIQADPDGNFVERSLVTNLLPFRDIGVQLHGDLLEDRLNYAVGVFNGATDGGNSDKDTNNNKEFIGRIFVHPFKQSNITSLEGLGIGISGTMSDPKGTTSATDLPTCLRTQSQESFFTYRTNVFANGKRRRISPQAYYYWKSLAVLGEYAKSSHEVSLSNNNSKLNNDAWEVAVSYIVTGEKNAFKGGITPDRPWGAVELAARYAELKLDEDVFPVFADRNKSASKVCEYTVGVNWFMNRNIRFMLDYGQAAFDGGGLNRTDRNEEKIILTRCQLGF